MSDKEDMFAASDSSSSYRPSKRSRLDDSLAPTDHGSAQVEDQDVDPTSAKGADPALLQKAKQRLSKWAARLFDPDRPRGLVEDAKIIPLNDEYLRAFGQRVRSEQGGDDAKVEETNVDSDNDGELYEDLPKDSEGKKPAVNRKEPNGTKIKLANLTYTTDSKAVQVACERFGPLLEVNLVQDKDKPHLNVGRGYVTFEYNDHAQACIEGLKELHGRPIRLSLADKRASGGPNANSGAPKGSLLNRYWDKDISTVCFRCGKVGHYEADCKSATKKAKPCPLCSSTTHEERGCPFKKICFNCGLPGHINRECPQRRGLPQRLVCGICFESGHHKFTCRNYRGSGGRAEQDAICMVCHRRGHFMCQDLKWFYELKGLYCFNCGGQGHLGYGCRRPNVFQCRDDPQLTNQELERAEAESIAEQLQQAQTTGQRGRRVNRGSGDSRSRHQSLPPRRPHGRGNSNQNQGGDFGGNRRQSGGGGNASKRGGQRGYYVN